MLFIQICHFWRGRPVKPLFFLYSNIRNFWHQRITSDACKFKTSEHFSQRFLINILILKLLILKSSKSGHFYYENHSTIPNYCRVLYIKYSFSLNEFHRTHQHTGKRLSYSVHKLRWKITNNERQNMLQSSSFKVLDPLLEIFIRKQSQYNIKQKQQQLKEQRKQKMERTKNVKTENTLLCNVHITHMKLIFLSFLFFSFLLNFTT